MSLCGGVEHRAQVALLLEAARQKSVRTSLTAAVTKRQRKPVAALEQQPDHHRTSSSRKKVIRLGAVSTEVRLNRDPNKGTFASDSTASRRFAFPGQHATWSGKRRAPSAIIGDASQERPFPTAETIPVKLTTSCFADGQKIPVECAFCAPDPKTHAGLSQNLNPDLSWSDLPPGTKSLVLLCRDPDVPSKPDDVNQAGRAVPASLPRIDFFPWVLVDLPADADADRQGRVREQRHR